MDERFKRLVEQKRELQKERPLESLFFELTDACNLKCLHCGSACSPQNARYLDINLIQKALDSLTNNNANEVFIVLTGGEPLLHPEFFQIIETIRKKGFEWGITTNATLIDEPTAKKMEQEKMASIAFSLDGDGAAHDYLRQNGMAFANAVRGIKTGLKYFGERATTMITSVVYKRNVNDLERIYQTVRELGVDYWRPINVEPIGRANKNQDLFLDADEFKKLFDFILEKRAQNSLPIVEFGCSHALPPQYEGKVRNGFFTCYSGITNAAITVNGDIYGCLDIERRPQLVQGNLNTDDLMDVWKNKFEIFRADRSNCEFCCDCEEREFCQGDSAHTWDFDNDRPLLCLNKLLK